MKKDVIEHVSQQVKAPRQQPVGSLQLLNILLWKWEEISMNFISSLPKTRQGFNVVWVNVDRLTKTTHFILGRATCRVDQWALLYVEEVVCLPSVPVSIVSNRDAKFTSKF